MLFSGTPDNGFQFHVVHAKSLPPSVTDTDRYQQ